MFMYETIVFQKYKLLQFITVRYPPLRSENNSVMIRIQYINFLRCLLVVSIICVFIKINVMFEKRILIFIYFILF